MEKQKANIRERYVSLRKSLTPSARAMASAAIFHHVVDQPTWKKAEIVLIYVSVGPEVETRDLIREAFKTGKRVAVPLVDPQRKEETLLAELTRLEDLQTGPVHGLQQPVGGHLINPLDIDLALLPGVAFDEFGGRLGFGSGYFDRLLPRMSKAAIWGLSYDAQLSDDPLPMEPHDFPVHAVITEDEVIYPDEVG